MRRVARVMEHRLPGRLPARGRGLVFAGVQVAIEAREVAGGDLDPDAVAGQEHVAGGPEVDGEAGDLVRDERCGSLARVAVAGADDAVGQVLRVAVGPDVDQLCGEVSVRGAAGREEGDGEGSGDLE